MRRTTKIVAATKGNLYLIVQDANGHIYRLAEEGKAFCSEAGPVSYAGTGPDIGERGPLGLMASGLNAPDKFWEGFKEKILKPSRITKQPRQ